MKLKVVVKQASEKTIKLANVKTYYIDKYNLNITLENGNYHRFKTSTVLEIEET